MNKSKNEIKIQNFSKFKKRFNFKKYKRINKNRKSKKRNNIILKLIIIFVLLCFTILIYKKIFVIMEKYLANSSEEINYDWKKNAKEIINKQISILNGQTFIELNETINYAQNFFNFPDYNEKENSTNNIEIKDKLIQRLSRISHKDFRNVKKIVIMRPFFFGNQIVALNNIIHYCEILGIKNFYFNSQYNFYVKNDIITNKINISVKSNKAFKCSDQDTFCGDLFGHFFFLL